MVFTTSSPCHAPRHRTTTSVSVASPWIRGHVNGARHVTRPKSFASFAFAPQSGEDSGKLDVAPPARPMSYPVSVRNASRLHVPTVIAGVRRSTPSQN